MTFITIIKVNITAIFQLFKVIYLSLFKFKFFLVTLTFQRKSCSFPFIAEHLLKNSAMFFCRRLYYVLLLEKCVCFLYCDYEVQFVVLSLLQSPLVGF